MDPIVLYNDDNPDNTRQLILGNTPIEDKLHVIAVISNPCNYKIRYKLARQFFNRMDQEQDVILYIVELVYGDQEFAVTTQGNKRHLQLRGETPLWHKENMINLGVKHLLPSDWKAFAWVDADIEFDNPYWATYALRVLNGKEGKDFIQLFTNVYDMDNDKQILNFYTGFGYQFSKNFKKGKEINYWHPGFAWACTRKAYDQIGGLLDEGILGSGDNIMCHSFIKQAPERLKKGMTTEYMDFVRTKQTKYEGLKLGYIPGSIRHYFHGKKENRNYYGREDILIRHKYDPNIFITRDANGLIIPTKECPLEFLKDIMDYFEERNEDEYIPPESIDTADNLTKQVNNLNLLLPAPIKPAPIKPAPIKPVQNIVTKTVPNTVPLLAHVTKAQVYKRQDPASQFKRLSFF
jgi:hypothetical protein